MTDVFDITSDMDVAPTSSDTSPLRCQYDGCTNSVTKPARGRTPKFCDEHKVTAKTSSGRSSAKWARADEIEKTLAKYLDMLAMGIMLVNPDDGRVIASGSDAVARELVELGRVDKTWRKWLERIAAPGKYGGLTAAMLPIIIGLMANHKLLPQFVIPGLTDQPIREGV